MSWVKANIFLFNIVKIFFVGVFVLTLPSFAFAQTESFSFTVTPQNPKPYQPVQVTLSSYSVNLDRAAITWTVDGNLQISGIGETRATIQTKGLGEVTLVKVEALFANGQKLAKTLAIQPAYLDILWEAVDSYTPPFYKGKALPAPEATIKVVAVPEIKKYDGGSYNPSSLIYTWKKGVETQQSASGYNKQYFSFKHNVFDKEQSISVDVASQDGFSSAGGSAVIDFNNPRVLVYEEDPKKGINFTQAFAQTSGRAFSGKTSLVAVPYFFSIAGVSDRDISFDWNINGNQTNPLGVKNKLTIEKSGDEGGLANIEVIVESARKLFQEGKNSFSIELQ